MPAPGFEAFGEPLSYNGKCTGEDNNHDLKEAEHIKLQKSCYQGPDINFKNLNWKVINGPFVSVWLHNVPWGSQDALPAPDAKVGSFMCFKKFRLASLEFDIRLLDYFWQKLSFLVL